MLNITSDFLSDITLNVDLNQKHDFTPKSESIKKYIDSEVNKVLQQSLEDDKDIELISFKPNINYIFRTFFSTNFIAFNTFNAFYKDESFYIFDLYDTYTDNNQNLISRNFVKMSKIDTTAYIPNIKFEVKNINKEYTNIYIPSYFMNTSADTFYLKISFFNATNGKLRFFECSPTDSGSLKNYFKIKLNKNNMNYQILNGDILTNENNQTITYRLIEVIEPIKESATTNENSLPAIKPTIKTKTTITSKGKFI
jgi:hypothetical protein